MSEAVELPAEDHTNEEVASVEMKPQETTTSSEGTSETMVAEMPSDPPAPPEFAVKADTDAILDATKELTKVVGELAKKLNTHMTAGKF